MTKDQRTLLDGLDSMPVGSAPIGDLLRGGKATARRRRNTLLTGVVAATLLVIGGGTVVAQSITNTDSERGDDSLIADESDPGGEGETRFVGIGGAYVAVPASWRSNDASCNTPIRDTYYFPYPQDCQSASAPRVSSLAMAANGPQAAGVELEGILRPDGELDGHEVLASPVLCGQSLPSVCAQTFAVPDMNAYFHVEVPTDDGGNEVVRSIRQSLALLDTDETVVPFGAVQGAAGKIVPFGSEAKVVAALNAAGFSVDVERTDCPDSASCVSGVTGIEPAVGTVVPAGSNVTVTVLN